MRYFLFLATLAIIFWYVLPPVPAVNAQSGMNQIRETSNGTKVYKFEDGPNTCYLADNKHKQTTTQNSTTLAVAISCFPRKSQ